MNPFALLPKVGQTVFNSLVDTSKGGYDVRGVNLTRNAGTGIPFVDFNYNNARPAPSAPGQKDTYQAPAGGGQNPDGTYNQAGAYTGGGGAAIDTDAQERAATLFGIDQGIAGAEGSLGRLDRQRDIGYGNIDRDYGREYDILTGQRRQNLDRYQQQETDQLNQYGAKRSNNNMQAANWLMGAQRRAGANGAGGGSAARYALPFDAQTQASAANSADQSVNNANMRAIAGSRQQDETEFGNAENDLQYQREQGRNDLTSRVEGQRAELLNQIGGLRGQREIANGGDFRAAQNAANPYTSRIQSILDSIDGLAATPAVKARQVNVGRPDLSGYNWSRPQNAPSPMQDPTLQGNNIIQQGEDDRDPILSLFGLDDRRRQYA